MTSPERFARPAMVMALTLTLLSACKDPLQPSQDDPNAWRDGVSSICKNRQPLYKYVNINLDNARTPVRIYVFRCREHPAKPRQDQLEVLDGRGDLHEARRLTTDSAILPSEKRDVYDGCVWFTHNRLLIAKSDGLVIKIGTWDNATKTIKLTSLPPSSTKTIPCEEARWQGHHP
ncbi:hypothetical protein ACFY36_19330 [Actinoplanes sp. NPDC000266]